MEINYKSEYGLVELDKLKRGDTFEYKGDFYTKTNRNDFNVVNLYSGVLYYIAHYEKVKPVVLKAVNGMEVD